MTIILGIDPGSRLTGYGIISFERRQARYISSGHIRTQGDALSGRLGQIFHGISEVVKRHQPTEVAIEQVFIHQNAATALKLGQARGAAIAAVAQNNLLLREYSARQVKKAVVGYGAADKTQIQQMVTRLLSLSQPPQSDAADALAIALCHAYTYSGS
ncbi:MAG: crossover junction endodeoxyribonuclease RuvC [Gammaproteobacteria bacterium]|nr:crossover junction endodeoxyribonuclease RuvC [Gammaproteobacteria bacterium]